MAQQAQGPVRDVVERVALRLRPLRAVPGSSAHLHPDALRDGLAARAHLPDEGAGRRAPRSRARSDPPSGLLPGMPRMRDRMSVRGHYGASIEQTRAWIERNHKRRLADRLQRWIVGALFPYPARLRIALAPLKLIERAGLRPFLERSMPGALREWVELLPPLAARVPVSERAVTAAAGDQRAVAVHRGCVAQVLADAANINAQICSPAPVTGSPDCPAQFAAAPWTCTAAIGKRALKFARANVRAIKNSGADFVISTASGCSTAMAEYGELLKDDPELAETARAVSAQVRELSGLLLDAPKPVSGRLSVPLPTTTRATWRMDLVSGRAAVRGAAAVD